MFPFSSVLVEQSNKISSKILKISWLFIYTPFDKTRQITTKKVKAKCNLFCILDICKELIKIVHI